MLTRTTLLLLGMLLSFTATAASPQAIFAGGCFWSMESAFAERSGVLDAMPGYLGDGKNRVEVIQVTYDPARIDYATLLAIYWRNTDPFDGTGQFCDRGPEYRPAIFTADAQQAELANRSLREIELRFVGRPVATQILPAGKFRPAEEFHRAFYVTNEARYKAYRRGCGQDQRLRQVWGDEAGGK